IYSDSSKILLFKEKLKKENISFDSLINKETAKIYSENNNEKYKMEIIIAKLKQSIRDNTEMMDLMKKKARKKEISIDSMITLDSKWLYKNDKY
ncbi:MAG: hypothetical protein PF487_09640, partial [Bacteroidales bacterium]|nr:hypothetical protein [Bacteroidales bacterium]